MSDANEEQALVLDYEFDEPPEKVWRALSTPALRERWLPEEHLADAEPIASVPGEKIDYRMREDEAPFRAGIVTFEVRPRQDGGTRLRIVHRLAPTAANDNRTCLMRAA